MEVSLCIVGDYHAIVRNDVRVDNDKYYKKIPYKNL